MQLAGPAGDRGLDLGTAFGVEIGDGVPLRMGGDHLGLKHAAGLRTDRKERAVGGAALLAEGGQHDVHDLVVMRQNRTQTVIEPARGVTVGRADEFIIEAEAVEEGLQAGIVVRTEGRVRSERVAHRRQRQAEIGLHRLAVGNIVGHLAKTVHIIRETDKPRLRAGHHLKSMAHHRCAHHLAEGADMRQAGRAIASLEQNLAVMVRGFQPFDQVAGLGKGPGLGVAGGVPDGGDAVGHDDRVLSGKSARGHHSGSPRSGAIYAGKAAVRQDHWHSLTAGGNCRRPGLRQVRAI